MTGRARVLAGMLSLSAAGLIGLVVNEGYTPNVITTAADPVPTGGFGSTKNETGQPLKVGEAMPPVRALIVLKEHVSRDEVALKASLPNVPLTQGEYDVYVDFVYQYGMGTFKRSSIRRELLDGNYRAACDALLKLIRHEKCLAEQS